MFNNLSDMASDSIDVFKEEFREVDEVVFENDMRDLICRQFGLSEEVYVRLIECRIDTESLLLLKDDDLKEIFPTNMLGLRVKLRSHLSQWQQQNGDQKVTPSKRLSRIPSPRISRIISTPSSTSMISTPPRNSLDQTSLFGLLQSCPKGQNILKYFEENSKILDEHRVSLVSVIVDSYKDRSMAMSMSDIVRYTDEIGVLFPSEEKKYYYSTRGKGLNPMGKLYDKAINARRKVRKPCPEPVVSDVNNKSTNNDFKNIVASNDELENKSWLSQNMKPWNEVLSKWNKTFKIRRADILKGEENILQNWPLFKSPMGYTLIDIDFVQLFPESPKDILADWQLFRLIIVPYLKEKIKDPDSKELMENLNKDISTDSRDCLIVLLLNAVIKPPLLSTKLLSPDGGNKRRKWKPSISDAQNATIMHCITMTDFQIKHEQLKFEASQKNKTLQPLLVVIGIDHTKLESFYVVYDCILYKVNSFIKSLDILIKIYYVMNFDFRLEAKYLYELIESYFFKIKTSSNPNIISLTNYLNDNKI